MCLHIGSTLVYWLQSIWDTPTKQKSYIQSSRTLREWTQIRLKKNLSEISFLWESIRQKIFRNESKKV